MRVSEAADALRVARSTAHRLLAMLVHAGFVRREPATRAYHVGPALVELALAVVAEVDLRAAIRPHLEALVAETGETAHLVALRGTDVVFLDGVESSKALRAGSRTGSALPAHATSGGKALLAALPDETLRALLPSERLTPVTARTVRNRSALFAELRRVRERGYAANVDESEAGLTAYACVVRGRGGQIRVALTIAGPTARMGGAGRTRIVGALRDAAAEAGSVIL